MYCICLIWLVDFGVYMYVRAPYGAKHTEREGDGLDSLPAQKHSQALRTNLFAGYCTLLSVGIMDGFVRLRWWWYTPFNKIGTPGKGKCVCVWGGGGTQPAEIQFYHHIFTGGAAVAITMAVTRWVC